MGAELDHVCCYCALARDDDVLLLCTSSSSGNRGGLTWRSVDTFTGKLFFRFHGNSYVCLTMGVWLQSVLQPRPSLGRAAEKMRLGHMVAKNATHVASFNSCCQVRPSVFRQLFRLPLLRVTQLENCTCRPTVTVTPALNPQAEVNVLTLWIGASLFFFKAEFESTPKHVRAPCKAHQA